MSIDTLSLARELRAAHFEGEQAEAIASAIGRAVVESAATKADLLQVKTELSGEIVAVRAEIKSSVESLRSTMLLWFVGTTITLAALILAALKL